MVNIKRTSAAALIGLASLGFSGCESLQQPLEIEIKLTQKNDPLYDSVLKSIEDAGVSIDKSKCVNFSGRPIVIYLPEAHTHMGQSFSKGLSQIIVERANIDAVGLEGLIGQVEEGKIKILQEVSKRARKEYNSEINKINNNYSIKLFEKPTIANLENPKPDEDLQRLEKCVQLGNAFLNLSKYGYIKTSPGIFYVDDFPGIKVFGIEKMDSLEKAHAYADSIDLRIYHSAANFVYLKWDFEMKRSESKIPKDKIKEVKQKAEEVKKTLEKDIIYVLRNGGWDSKLSLYEIRQSYPALVIDKRTEEWFESIKKYGGKRTLVIGGALHAPKFFSEAKNGRYSLITVSSEYAFQALKGNKNPLFDD